MGSQQGLGGSHRRCGSGEGERAEQPGARQAISAPLASCLSHHDFSWWVERLFLERVRVGYEPLSN